MSVAARLSAFALLLAAVFAAAALAGGLVDPDGASDATGTAHGATATPHDTDGTHGGASADAHGAGGASDAADHGADAGADHGTAGHADGTGQAAAPPGLTAEQDGYRLVLDTAPRTVGVPAPLRLRILGPDGRAVRRFDVAHERRLHLVVVRRDLQHFRHVHPVMGADGTWSIRLALPAAGTYRLYADTTIDRVQRTLGTDVQLPGTFTPRSVARPATLADAGDGLQVRRRPGPAGSVAFDVLRDGRVVTGELEDHLGARGHLVTLRAGDLAYLHTHPTGDRLAFGVELPGPGTYRSWVEFRLDGRVHTAAFTEVVPG